jgi:hypothetical protein
MIMWKTYFTYSVGNCKVFVILMETIPQKLTAIGLTKLDHRRRLLKSLSRAISFMLLVAYFTDLKSGFSLNWSYFCIFSTEINPTRKKALLA